MDGRLAEVPLYQEDLHGVLRPAAVAFAVLCLAGAAQAAGGENAELAAVLKPAIQKRYTNGDVFSRVTCDVPSMKATRATCNAYFTNTGEQLKGVFHVDVTIARSTGNITWQEKSVSCTDLKSGKTLAC